MTGIANPLPLQQFVRSVAERMETVRYSDHHIYTIDDLKDIRSRFAELEGNKIILTTEKDAVRLYKFENELKELPLYVIPVKHHFLFGEEEKFLRKVCGYVEKNKLDKQDNNQ